MLFIPFSIATEKIVYKENDLCITPGMSVNGRLFVSSYDNIDNIVCILLSYI